MNNKTQYHNRYSCNSCGKDLNSLSNAHFDGSYIYSCATRCKGCGFEDHWETGFFESGTYMKSNCKTYSF